MPFDFGNKTGTNTENENTYGMGGTGGAGFDWNGSQPARRNDGLPAWLDDNGGNHVSNPPANQLSEYPVQSPTSYPSGDWTGDTYNPFGGMPDSRKRRRRSYPSSSLGNGDVAAILKVLAIVIPVIVAIVLIIVFKDIILDFLVQLISIVIAGAIVFFIVKGIFKSFFR